jgi:hypothetical protein
MALKRLAEAEEILKPRIRKYVKLLFEDPSGYLHSACQGVRLSSILEILKYVTAESNVDKLFDEHIRTAIFNTCSIESWTDSIPLRSRNAILALVAPSLGRMDVMGSHAVEHWRSERSHPRFDVSS